MACKRSAVRSRLAPPAFACFASYSSASHAEVYRSEASEGCRAIARRATAGLGKSPPAGHSRKSASDPFASPYSPNTAFSLSRSATISFFIADSSPIEHAEAARIDCGTLRAFSRSA
jgi:hypothetical protein